MPHRGRGRAAQDGADVAERGAAPTGTARGDGASAAIDRDRCRMRRIRSGAGAAYRASGRGVAGLSRLCRVMSAQARTGSSSHFTSMRASSRPKVTCAPVVCGAGGGGGGGAGQQRRVAGAGADSDPVDALRDALRPAGTEAAGPVRLTGAAAKPALNRAVRPR